MSSDDLQDQIGDLFGGDEAPPGYEKLFSDVDISTLGVAGEAAQPVEATETLEVESAEKGKPQKKGAGLGLRLFSQERLTLSVEADEVRVLICRGQQILRWDRALLPSGTVRNGQVIQLEAFGEAVTTLLQHSGAPRKKAVVSLGGQRSLVRIINLPSVSARLLDETIQRAARRELPLPLDELYLSYQVLGDRNAARLQVFILGVPREALDSCVVGLRDVGVRLQTMDLKPLALVRAVNLPDVVLANLETQTESVVLVRDFVPYIVRSIAVPGESARSPADRAENLVAEIQRTLDFYSSTRAAEHAPWSPVVCLTGALGDAEAIRSRLGKQWPLVDPAPPLALPDGFPLLPYLVNVGLVLKRAS
jgi:Tfp pilus assembly PilM family ATPase